MDAIFSQDSDKRRVGRRLGGKQWPQMITSRQVRAALRRLRTDANMTPEEFADEANVHRATIYRIEKMEENNYPRIETISALVDSRGLSMSAFFAGIEGVTSLEAAETAEAAMAEPLLDPRSPEFERQLERLVDAAVSKRLRGQSPSESRRERTQAARTKSGRGPHRRPGPRKTGT